ncbi:MAG: NAD(+)/NADH kinase [Candidatus Aenigmarchaeota archaeon]|nr:NAD(+)/NADH kinase [Candidatus Aenigmarchaeota archaeon]
MAKEQKKKKTLKILIIAKQNKAGIRAAKRIEKKLEEFTKDIEFDLSTALQLREHGTPISRFDGDLVITVGGDGTFLWAAHKTKKPILPVKIEGYGFLCTTTEKELLENIPNLVKGNYKIIERMRLACSKIAHGHVESYLYRILHKNYPLSLNEITFARKRPSKILRVEVKIDDTVFNCTGDGVMFATPSGSTGYNASSGGSLIDHSLDAISMTTLYPFFSKMKPIIIPANKRIEIFVKGGECALVIDGHGGDYIKSSTTFVIEKSEPAKIITFKDYNFYEKINKELIET